MKISDCVRHIGDMFYWQFLTHRQSSWRLSIMGSLERQLSARGFCDTQAGTLALERGEKETLLKSNSAAGVGMNVQ